MNNDMVFLWETTESGNIRLLRVYGDYPYVEVPDQIEGHCVTEIGAYCFAQKEHLSQEQRAKLPVLQTTQRPLCGDFVERVTLPDSVHRMGRLAFYNCRKLSRISVGSDLTEIESDAFMNCMKLEEIVVRSDLNQPSGLMQILAQRSEKTEVYFEVNGQIQGRLSYPEYYELHDEIGPAHIFELKLEGEGFRARQCFENGVVDLQQYDAVFPQACAEEAESTLSKMAINRLEYPVGLLEAAKNRYEQYFIQHMDSSLRELVKERNLKRLFFLQEQGYLSLMQLQCCRQYAQEAEWGEGLACLLRMQQEQMKEKQEERYSFDGLF